MAALRGRDGIDSAVAAIPSDGLGASARFELLVHVEKMADLIQGVVVDVADILHVGEARVRCRHRENRRLPLPAFGHPEHSDWPHGDVAARKSRLLEEDENAQRRTVLGTGPRREAVVDGIAGGGEQRVLEPDPAADLVEQVGVSRSLGAFHDRVPGRAVAFRVHSHGCGSPRGLGAVGTTSTGSGWPWARCTATEPVKNSSTRRRTPLLRVPTTIIRACTREASKASSWAGSPASRRKLQSTS